MLEIISAGFGGQGVLTAGLILAKVSMDNGKNVTWIPSYGSEMRGGTANCNVKVSDAEIASPFVKKIDVLIAMNGPSIDKFESSMKEGGTIIVNSSMIKDRKFREDLNIVEVPANDIARYLGNPRGANIAILGGLVKVTNVLEKDAFADGIDKFFADKGKVNELNRLCFEKGYDFVSNKEAK